MTLHEIVARREDLERQRAAKRARLSAIATERQAARRAGDASLVLRLDVEAEDLQTALADLDRDLAALVEPERVAGEAVVATRRQKAVDDAESYHRETFWRMAHALEAFGREASDHRRATIALGEARAEQQGNRDLVRQTVLNDGGRGFVLRFAEWVASWLATPPGAGLQPPPDDPKGGPEAQVMTLARDSFFKR
jgi:hypothetical protein